eukprot:jgi/Botrbrau1/23521/Bobra.106_1s0068.1
MDSFDQGRNMPPFNASLPKPRTLAPPPGYTSARPISLPRPAYGAGAPSGAQCQQQHAQMISFPQSQSPCMPRPRPPAIEQPGHVARPPHVPCPSPNLVAPSSHAAHHYSHWPHHQSASQSFAGPVAQSVEGCLPRPGPRDPRLPAKLHQWPPCNESLPPGPSSHAGKPFSSCANRI